MIEEEELLRRALDEMKKMPAVLPGRRLDIAANLMVNRNTRYVTLGMGLHRAFFGKGYVKGHRERGLWYFDLKMPKFFISISYGNPQRMLPKKKVKLGP